MLLLVIVDSRSCMEEFTEQLVFPVGDTNRFTLFVIMRKMVRKFNENMLILNRIRADVPASKTHSNSYSLVARHGASNMYRFNSRLKLVTQQGYVYALDYNMTQEMLREREINLTGALIPLLNGLSKHPFFSFVYIVQHYQIPTRDVSQINKRCSADKSNDLDMDILMTAIAMEEGNLGTYKDFAKNTLKYGLTKEASIFIADAILFVSIALNLYKPILPNSTIDESGIHKLDWHEYDSTTAFVNNISVNNISFKNCKIISEQNFCPVINALEVVRVAKIIDGKHNALGIKTKASFRKAPEKNVFTDPATGIFHSEVVNVENWNKVHVFELAFMVLQSLFSSKGVDIQYLFKSKEPLIKVLNGMLWPFNCKMVVNLLANNDHDFYVKVIEETISTSSVYKDIIDRHKELVDSIKNIFDAEERKCVYNYLVSEGDIFAKINSAYDLQLCISKLNIGRNVADQSSFFKDLNEFVSKIDIKGIAAALSAERTELSDVPEQMLLIYANTTEHEIAIDSNSFFNQIVAKAQRYQRDEKAKFDSLPKSKEVAPMVIEIKMPSKIVGDKPFSESQDAANQVPPKKMTNININILSNSKSISELTNNASTLQAQPKLSEREVGAREYTDPTSGELPTIPSKMIKDSKRLIIATPKHGSRLTVKRIQMYSDEPSATKQEDAGDSTVNRNSEGRPNQERLQGTPVLKYCENGYCLEPIIEYLNPDETAYDVNDLFPVNSRVQQHLNNNNSADALQPQSQPNSHFSLNLRFSGNLLLSHLSHKASNQNAAAKESKIRV